MPNANPPETMRERKIKEKPDTLNFLQTNAVSPFPVKEKERAIEGETEYWKRD